MDEQLRRGLLKGKALYERKLARVVETLRRTNKALQVDSNKLCWECPGRLPNTTDLSDCQIANLNYPEPCYGAPVNNWELYKKASATLLKMSNGDYN